MNRHGKGNKNNNHNKSRENECVFPKEWNLPKLQMSFNTAHRHVATLATEPNKPLDRISFLIRPTLPGSHQTNIGSLYLQPLLHTTLLIWENRVHSSIYLST